MELNETNVKTLFDNCKVLESEMDGEVPQTGIPYTTVECVKATHHMHDDRITANLEDIRIFYNKLPHFFIREAGVEQDKYKNVLVRYDGVSWGRPKEVDKLIALMIASGFLVFKYTRAQWQTLPRGYEYLMVEPT